MSLFDAPERFASWVGSVIRENFKTVLLLALGAWLAVMFDVVSVPNLTIPLWARVVGTFGATAAVGGYLAATIEFDDEEPDWIYVIEFNVDDERTPRITKVTEAVLADMTVVGGRLRAPQGTDRIVACRYFNRSVENPVAHCTWRDLPADTDLLGVRPSAIEREVAALRDTFEETHGRYQWVLDHLYMVVRRLDFKRTESQNAILEGHLTPSARDGTIADVVDKVVPEELRPDRFDAGDATAGNGQGSRADRAGDDVEDDLTGPDPEQASDLPAVADGGESDE